MPNASPNSGVLLLVIKLYIDLFLPLFLPSHPHLGFCIALVLFLSIKMKLYFKSVI